MSDPQRRYTDKELITLLRILASDYNRKPTQRNILDDDRLPTHHTLNKRFGGVNEALAVAGLTNLKESNLHNTVKDVLEYYGVDFDEWVQVGPLVTDFKAEIRGEMEYIDIIQMLGTNIQGEVALMRGALAAPYADAYRQIADIGDVVKLIGVLSGFPTITDMVSE
jgi:hypothetical protein